MERAKRERTELDAEERQLRDIERLVKRARETGEDQVAEATDYQRGEGDAPIKIGIGGGGGALGKARMKEGRAACALRRRRRRGDRRAERRRRRR